MSTGEVTNLETALADIDQQIAEIRDQLEAAAAARASIEQVEQSVEAMQSTYDMTARAASTALDHEAAMNLDGTTLAHSGTASDAMPVGAVNDLYEQTERTKALIDERTQAAETALAALEAKRAHLIATYADAADTVATNLGGDSRFVGSDPATAAPDPAPVPAGV